MNRDSSISNLFAELSDLATELNQKSETINKRISTVEDELRRLNIGLEVWSPEPLQTHLFHSNSGPLEGRLHLGFAPRAGNWHLCVRGVTFREGAQSVDPVTRPISKDDKLLRDTSREVRIAALQPAAQEQLLRALKARVKAALQIIGGEQSLGEQA
jgi:hypothetical protein